MDCACFESVRTELKLVLALHSGYAVTAGHFSSPVATDIAAGAPQDGGGGKVWEIFILSMAEVLPL